MKSEEMLSSQMLSGIPEVDLGKRVQLFHEKPYYFKRLLTTTSLTTDSKPKQERVEGFISYIASCVQRMIIIIIL